LPQQQDPQSDRGQTGSGGPDPESARAAAYAGAIGWKPPTPEEAASTQFYRPATDAPPAAVPGLTFGMTPIGGFGDAPRTGGMLAASILLLISGTLATLIFLAVLAFGRLSPIINVLGVTGVADIVVAVGLFRGSRTFRIWGLLRAIGCIVIFGLIGPLTGQVNASGPAILLQVGFAAGLVILLLGEKTSGPRIGLGVGVVVLCFFAAVAWGVVITLKGASFGSGFRGYVSQDRAFVDEKNGVRLDLPTGWVLLGKNNPFVIAMRVNAICYHPQSGSYAAVLIDPTYGASQDLGPYITYLERSRFRPGPGMTETSREPITFAGLQGIRFHAKSAGGLVSISGYSDVCEDKFNHYVLYGWCTGLFYNRSYRAFQDLEKNFQITMNDDQRFQQRAVPLQEVMPYLSGQGAKRLAEYVFNLHRRSGDQGAGIQAMDAFVGLLPTSDHARFYSIFNQALSSLPAQNAKLARADRQDLETGVELAPSEAVNFADMMSRAFASLSPDKRAQIEQLADAAIDAGIARYSPGLDQNQR